MITFKEVTKEAEKIVNEFMQVRIHNEICKKVGADYLIKNEVNKDIQEILKNNEMVQKYLNQIKMKS